MDAGYEQATSVNLPEVDYVMLHNYFVEHAHFTGIIDRKQNTYGEKAVGFVQVKRENNICFLKCKISPEHKVHKAHYAVSVCIDEEKEEILSATCHDCVASAGNCKHSNAVLLWLYMKSETPAPTDVECYWKKSTMATVGPSTFILASKLGKPDPFVVGTADAEGFFNDFIHDAFEEEVDCQTARNELKLLVERVFLTNLLIKFIQEKRVNNCDEFLAYAKLEMKDSICEVISNETISQSTSEMWNKARFGRITASKLYQAAHCKTEDGTFVRNMLGSFKLKDNEAMKRGRRLENEVLKVLAKEKNINVKKVGLILSKEYPLFGASPDGISDDYVIEIKCPTSTKSKKNYLTQNNRPTAKCNAQLQMQMLFANKKEALFVVADENFERSKKIDVVSVKYNESEIFNLMKSAEVFWKNYIYPVLYTSFCEKE